MTPSAKPPLLLFQMKQTYADIIFYFRLRDEYFTANVAVVLVLYSSQSQMQLFTACFTDVLLPWTTLLCHDTDN